MYKNDGIKLMMLTKEWLKHYWQLDVGYLESYLDEEIVMIGTSFHEFYQGRNMVSSALEQFAAHINPKDVQFRECMVVQQNPQSCTITGRYVVVDEADMQDFKESYTRQIQNTDGGFHTFTFLWTQRRGESDIRLRHVHLSEPDSPVRERRGLGYTVTLQKGNERIMVKNNDNYFCFLNEVDILYVASDGRKCRIYMTDGTCMKANISLYEFMSEIGTAFYRFHRKYAVNRSYVAAIPRYRLVLVDGTALPIPIKQYVTVLNELSEDKKRIQRDREKTHEIEKTHGTENTQIGV